MICNPVVIKFCTQIL